MAVAVMFRTSVSASSGLTALTSIMRDTSATASLIGPPVPVDSCGRILESQVRQISISKKRRNKAAGKTLLCFSGSAS
jgi:hypothetical protein